MNIHSADTALVVGVGRSGMAAIRFLVAQGLRVLVSEARSDDELDRALLGELNELGVELECGQHSETLWRQADLSCPARRAIGYPPPAGCCARGLPIVVIWPWLAPVQGR